MILCICKYVCGVRHSMWMTLLQCGLTGKQLWIPFWPIWATVSTQFTTEEEYHHQIPFLGVQIKREGNAGCLSQYTWRDHYIKETDTFRSTATGIFYQVHVSASCTCKTECVVYLIGCMTTRALHKCFNEHGSDIRLKKQTSVAEHFNHSKKDLTIMIIDQEDNVKTLREREGYLINKLETKAHGLNCR